MAKGPFKNLTTPAANTNPPEKHAVLPKTPKPYDRTVNEERTEGEDDGDKALPWPKPETPKMPMRLNNGGK